MGSTVCFKRLCQDFCKGLVSDFGGVRVFAVLTALGFWAVSLMIKSWASGL